MDTKLDTQDPFLDDSIAQIKAANDGVPEPILTAEEVKLLQPLGHARPNHITSAQLHSTTTIKDSQHYLVILAAMGLKDAQIAEEMQRPVSWVKLNLARPEIKEMIRARHEEVFGAHVKDRIAVIAHKAMDVLEEALQEGNEIRVRMDAAKYLIDHKEGKATQKTEIKGSLLTEFLAKIDQVSKSYTLQQQLNPVDKPKDAVEDFIDNFIAGQGTGIIGARTLTNDTDTEES